MLASVTISTNFSPEKDDFYSDFEVLLCVVVKCLKLFHDFETKTKQKRIDKKICKIKASTLSTYSTLRKIVNGRKVFN